MAQLDVKVHSVMDQANCSILSLGSEDDHLRVMELKDLAIGGRRIGLQSVRERWGATRIFDFIAEELRVEQESWVLGGKQSQKTLFADGAQKGVAAVTENSGGGGRSAGQRGQSPRRTQSGSASPSSPRPAATTSPGGGKALWKPGPTCGLCKDAGRSSSHSWLQCEHARAVYIKRHGQPPPKDGFQRGAGTQQRK